MAQQAPLPATPSSHGARALRALAFSAAAIPTLASSTDCHALGPSEKTETRFAYMYYRDWQSDDDRIEIDAPMAWVKTPVGEHAEIEGNFVLDSVSGASPFYHDTLSGASGRGIEDERTAADLSATYYFERFSVSAGLSTSNEDDYDSLGGLIELRTWTPNNNTQLSLGISTAADDISSTNSPDLDESQDTFGLGIGLVQIINKRSMLQSNVTVALEDGYLSDPYKSFDNRPRSRDGYAWLTRYVLYIPSQKSSLHADYRFFLDTWGVDSHLIEVAYYQPLGKHWLVRPRMRYYTQDKADFYSKLFPPAEGEEGFYSADQRLSGFGSIAGGLRIERALGDTSSLNVSIDYFRQQGSWKAFSPGSPDLEALNALILGVGLYFKY